MIIRLYEDCMGRLHLRVNGTLYCNVQEQGGSFVTDAPALVQGQSAAAKAGGLNYLVFADMFKRPGGPRLLAMWKDGQVVVFKKPHTGTGCRYLLLD